MERDERVFVMGEDVGQRGGIGEAARAYYGTNGALKVPMTVRIPYGGGIRGGLFHSQNVEALFFHTPGLLVVTPSTPYEAKGLLKSAIRDDNPVIFLEHKKTYRLVRGEVPDDDYTIPIGPDGIAAEVVDLRTLKPLDTATILASVRKTGKLLIVHEDNISGGIGAEIAALAADEAFEYLDAPIARLCGPDVPTMPFAQTLEDAYMPNPEAIASELRRLASY
ncbi:2-oxoisovalerate dehydrogenase subunit beta [Geodia barretti]|uniref:2-oxoisovalerate dehydrogenase subunit beta n=1 Tax=Geodia barretti TaxID=519541 RepID=A0AA35TE68_GEOBA|nr:2-oxoisovalerate dehydrogenase subunit beta [Geodia barretti]